MKKLVLLLLFFLAICIFLPNGIGYAKEAEGERIDQDESLAKVAQDNVLSRTLVNIGQVALWIEANGRSATFPFGNASGCYYPRGSTPATAVIYQDGLVWGGRVNDGIEPEIRVGGQTYATATQPGRIISPGVAEDRSNRQSVNRIWRIRRDFMTVSDSDLQQDAAEVLNTGGAANVTPGDLEQLRAVYRQDWLDWPWEKGAPFYDADGDKEYHPTFYPEGHELAGQPILYPDGDEPGYANGDQVVWLVGNDLDVSITGSLGLSPPIGLEMQCTLWAYRRADAMGYIIFKEFRLIYKGRDDTPVNAYIDSMYVCAWCDPDLGDSGDDFVGCDTLLSLGYCYNATSTDATYSQAGYPPAAGGYDFFAGPRIASPGDQAIWHLNVIDDYTNLGMTSFGFFASGQDDSDPTLRDYQGTLQWWNLLRGNRPRPETPPEPWTNPHTGERTMFRVPGDPVAGTGWIDAGTGDRRMLQVSGPFRLDYGDTTEVVVALLGAMGADRLSSVSVLKFYDQSAQEAFDVAFDLPKAPESPALRASEMDQGFLLNWGYNNDKVRGLESRIDKGFAFEGYNVYQLPNAGAGAELGIKLATYDVVNEVTTISQATFDDVSGQVLNLPVQLGGNSGLSRTLQVEYDEIRQAPLANGRTYFFAVTAYSFNPDPEATLKTLESTLALVTVTPQQLKPGVRLPHETGDLVESTHVSGGSDGSVTIEVIDPTRTTDHNYEVVFDTLDGGNVWHLNDVTTGERKLSNQTNQSGDDDYITVDGLMVRVIGPAAGFHGVFIVHDGTTPRPETSDDVHASVFMEDVWHYGWNEDDYWPLITYPDGGRYWVTTHPGYDAAADNAAYVAAVMGYFGPEHSIPYDFEWRWVGDGEAWAINYREPHTGIPAPFEIWNVGINTPDDDSDDFQMIPRLLDDDGTGDLSWHGDAEDSGGADDAFTDRVYWYNPVEGGSYADFAAFLDAGDDASAWDQLGQGVLARTVFMCHNGVGGHADSIDVSLVSSADPAAWTLADTTIMKENGLFVDTENSLGTVAVNAEGTHVVGYHIPFPPSGAIYRCITNKPNVPEVDSFTFTTEGVSYSADAAKADVKNINVFPNPYYGFNIVETNRFARFVTFSHLPEVATIRVFTIAGVLVRTIEKDDPDQFTTWNLQNENSLPVASGIYLVYIDMPDLGETKILKAAIIMEKQFLDLF